MMDDTTLEHGLRARPPADPVYRSRITASPPTVVHAVSAPEHRPPTGACRLTISATRLVAAVAIVGLAAGGLFLAGGQGPSPVPTVGPASPSPTAAPSARLGQGPVLTWTKLVLDPRSLKLPDPAHPAARADRSTKRIAWVDDRFVLADRDAGAVSTSTDGASWIVEEPDGPAQDHLEALLLQETATWHDRLVGWNSRGLRIVRPPDEPIAKSFEGPAGAVGIGPAGIVVRTHSTLDFDAVVRSLLGDDSLEHIVDITFEDGILRITTDDERELEVDWAARGFEPGDVADRGFGWYSPDGEEWTPIPGFPANVERIVGVSDGFILLGPSVQSDAFQAAMWHSPDGLAWREIGPTAWLWDILPWAGGALVLEQEAGLDLQEGGRLALWDSAGVRELPMTAEIPARSPDASDISVGPLGIVWFEPGEVLFSPDGSAWSIAALPDDMAQGVVGAETVAVGERSVLVLTWSSAVYSDDGEDRLIQEPVPSLWLGTLAP
jgi:hypothetical protein